MPASLSGAKSLATYVEFSAVTELPTFPFMSKGSFKEILRSFSQSDAWMNSISARYLPFSLLFELRDISVTTAMQARMLVEFSVRSEARKGTYKPIGRDKTFLVE